MVIESMIKEIRIYNGEETVSLIIGTGKIEQISSKIMKLEHSLTYTHTLPKYS